MDVREKIALFPHSPGVYRYYDAGGTVIYVGKAKDLHKRVAQYFVDPSNLNAKTRVLVSKIADAAYSVVDSESDALLLENNLIKQYKPKYNILLKDSKTYPWICITDEPFPRVFLTRRVEKNGASYFGPYSSVMHARSLLDFFKQTYPLRSCKYKLDSQAIIRGKIRPCLDYHIGLCKGCCCGKISLAQYDANIREIERLLKGDARQIIKEYAEAMKAASDNLEFEAAQFYKVRMEQLSGHYSKSIIASSSDLDCDVFSLSFDSSNESFGNFLRVRGGAVVQSLNLGFKTNIEEERESVLSEFIAEMNAKTGGLSKTVIVPFLPDFKLDGITYRMPGGGEKLGLLELSQKNAEEFRRNSLSQMETADPDAYRDEVLEELRKALGMKDLPRHMECFDNSNIQGTNPVASCVVFRNAVPSKKDYRKFKIKTVIGANDYASMKEVVNRRYSRMMAEAPEDLPQLVVIDGGKGQLEFAYQAICELGLEEKVTLIGLAKRLEEVIRVGDPYPLFLDRNSRALKVLQQIRDEAHRFGITFHRSLRSKAQIASALRSIKGVGEQTETRLLLRFGSVQRIASAPVEAISEITGPLLAERIKKELNEN